MQIARITHKDFYNCNKNAPISNNIAVPKYDYALKQSQIPANKISPIYFTGIQYHNKYEPKPYLKSTIQTLGEIYDEYDKNIQDTKPEQIDEMLENIQSNTSHPKTEILSAMRDVTQFGAIQSVEYIGKTLREHNIGTIGNISNNLSDDIGYTGSNDLDDFLFNDNGLHDTLDYLLNQKNIYPLNKKNNTTAILLDDNKIEKLEKIYKNNNTGIEFIKNIPNIKFFMLSGWDNGVTFLDRTKSIEEKTIDVLNSGKNIDDERLERLNKIGISPIIIQNKQPANSENIYKNIAPLKMNREQLYALVDANFQYNLKGEKNNFIAKDITTNYLKENLLVYSPEKLSKDLKEFHDEIVKFAETKGKTEDDLIYLIPEKSKSYGYINYSYKKINNIPSDRFINSEELLSSKYEDKTIVILDDCAITGNSYINLQNSDIDYNAINKTQVVICAALYGTKKAKENMRWFQVWKNVDNIFHKENNEENLKYDYIDIGLVLGYGYKGSESSLVFPYMTPDNNSEIGSTIGLYHNVNMYSDTNTNNPLYRAIKTQSSKIMDIYDLTKKLINFKHNYENTAIENTENLNLKKLNITEIQDIYDSYVSDINS